MIRTAPPDADPITSSPQRWLVDGNNVMGSGADGWWNDPLGAAVRLAEQIAVWCRMHDDVVTVVFDGAPESALRAVGGGTLRIDFARRSGRDAADDRIVELVEEAFAEEPRLIVVTSDKGLVARLPPGVAVEGVGRFRSRVGLSPAGRRGRATMRGPRPGRRSE